jgi:type IV pilus assembly protein PilY1
MTIRHGLRRIRATLVLLAGAWLLPVAAAAMSGAPSADPPPLDAYGDDTFLISTSLSPNVILIMDNSESMNQIEWHPAFDQEATPVCAHWDNSTDYNFDALKTEFGIPANPTSISVTVADVNCGRTRTLWDPSQLDAKSVETLYSGRYLNWYFSAEADPYVTEIETKTTTGPGCKGTPFPDVYRRTRFEASKQVMLDVLCVAESKNVRFGLAVFRAAKDSAGKDPNGGYIVTDLGRANPNHAAELEAAITNSVSNDLTPDGNDETPLAETLFQVYTYWMSRVLTDLPISDQNGDGTPSTFPRYQYKKDGTWTTISTQWFDDALLYPCEKAFVIIVTDGSPTHDDFDVEQTTNEATGFASFGDLIGDYYADGEDETPGAYGLTSEAAYYLDDIAKYMYENDFRPDMAGDQTIDTYTVGFATDTTTNAFLQRTATLGNGLNFTAKDGEQLANQLVAALNDIIEKSASFTAASVPSARTEDGGDFYQSYFFPRSSSAFWEGHIRAWHIDANGNILDKNNVCALDDPTPGQCNSGPFLASAEYFWDAADQMPSADESTGRKLYVSNSTSYEALPESFVQANIDAVDLDIQVFTNPGMVPSDPTPNSLLYQTVGSTALTEEGLADEIVAYVRGCEFSTGVSSNVNTPSACIDRPARLGDVFHSNPVVVRSPNQVQLGFGDTSYQDFKTHYATTYPRDRVLYAGTNGGFVEAIHAGVWDASATPPSYDEGTGTELFGFMPWWSRLTIKNQPIDTAIQRTHYVDGDIQSADVWMYSDPTLDNNKASTDWRTIIVGAMREGGDEYYALDVTNPNGSISPDLVTTLPYPGYLWEFPDEADTGSNQQWMGQTWGKPVITKVKLNVDGAGPVERWVVIVTGGYDDTADPNPAEVTNVSPEPYVAADIRSRSIFMLDAKTGGVIAEHKFDSSATDAHADMKYAFVAKPSVLDLNSDGYADVAYFVDMGGQVFKWVFHDPGEDRVNDIDTSPPSSQPAWTFNLFFQAPTATISGVTYYKNLFFAPAAAYAGGQLWLAFGTGERRNLSFPGVGGDPDSVDTENNRYYVVSDPDPYELQSPALGTVTESDLMDLTSNESGATVTGRGFYFKVANGEKFVTNSEIFAGQVVAASFTPTSTGDPCTSRGDGKLYVFDLQTGQGFFTDGGGSATRGLDIGPGLPTDPQISVGAGGEDNKLIIEKSGTDLEIIDEKNINIGGGLLYWREKL